MKIKKNYEKNKYQADLLHPSPTHNVSDGIGTTAKTLVMGGV